MEYESELVQNEILMQINALAERYEQIEDNIRTSNLNDGHLEEIFQCMYHMECVINVESNNVIIMALLNLKDQMFQQLNVIKTKLEERNTGFKSSTVVVKKDNSLTINKSLDNIKVIPKIRNLGDLAGLTDIKKELISYIILPIFQPQLFNHFQVSNSILLYGPPGTGKTLLAHALAAETNAEFYCVSASSILSPYVGESEEKLKSIFENAFKEKTCSIIFIDEIDGLCRRRDTAENESTRRLKTEMMCQLNLLESYRNAYLICATNCPWDLDNAFVRRFNRKLYIPLPNRAERFEFLKLFTKDNVLINTKKYWSSVVTKLEGYSGADISNVIRYALNLPVKELLDVHSWKLINGKYKPADLCQESNGNIINCTIQQLPKFSVVARDPQYIDLLTAVNIIQRTTTDEYIAKYNNYI